MGGSLALALRQVRPELELVGSDSDAATMREALRRGMVSEGDPHQAELVVLAAPIGALPDLLAGLGGHQGLVTDLASTKVRVMGWAAAAGVDLVGGHPMCGRERSGIAAADAAIFRGAPWVLTRDEPAVTDLVRAVGATPCFMDAERHDRLVAGVSHAAFLVSAAYVLALSTGGDWEGMRQVAGPGFRDLSRLAAGSPELYSAIVSTNREPILRSLLAVEGSLAKLRRHLEAGDARLVELLEEAKLARDLWEREANRAGDD
jgi:prephenate dehydrogenase